MCEDPAYSRAVSLHLSRALDEIGVNKLAVRRRRHALLYSEKVNTYGNYVRGIGPSVFYFGSQTEGATTLGLSSDLDSLYCYYEWNVIEDWSEWKQGKYNVLMLQENTAAGYCRLQLLGGKSRKYQPHEKFTLDDRGRVLIKNTITDVGSSVLGHNRNGPANVFSNNPGMMDVDQVHAFPCRAWPAQAEEFTRRRRRHGWPSRRLLQQATGHGVFLVPVGHKLSPTEPLEWRISTSLAERCLIFSLTIVHIKCYVVLKMLMKTFVEPYIRKCISSYHCKTVILYCTENSELAFWREENLLQCVQRCLAMLLHWVTVGFCPQYVMPLVNLFAGKVTVRNKDSLQTIFTDLVKTNGRALLHVCIDDLGYTLYSKLSTEPSAVQILSSDINVRLIFEFECLIHVRTHSDVQFTILSEKDTTLLTAVRRVHQKIRMFRDRIIHANLLERQALQAFTEALCCWLGSLLASVALSRKMRVPRAAVRLIRNGANYDVASLLKLASVYHCDGEFHKMETVLQNVDDYFSRQNIQPACPCYGQPFLLNLSFKYLMFMSRGRRNRAKLFAPCVMFSPQEVHCAPPAILNELFRSYGDDANNRHPVHDIWMDLAVVDCQPYMYYLQAITFRQLGKVEDQNRTVSKLERCIRESYRLNHLETALNLLGQCKEMEQNPVAAMMCYITSLIMRPRNNAANWHVAILCYKMVKHRL